MATTAKRLNPGDRDWIRRHAGISLDECGPTNRAVAKAIGAREDTTSRIRNGRRPSPISRFMEIVWKLATDPRTTPWPLLMEAESVAEQALMATMDERDLVRRFHQLVREESRKQGSEDSATTDFLASQPAQTEEALEDELEALERAHLEESSLQREFAAVCRELRRRKIDPRRPA